MLDNNHHNLSCAFAEQIVSYLYDEANAVEKAAFDAHLHNCSRCAEELAGFGLVRSSIIEWKKADFFNLEIPSIEIPYRAAISTEKQSWFSGFRKLFMPSPAWSTALAVVIVCVGLAFLALNFSNSVEVTKDDRKVAESVVSPVIEKQVGQPVDEMTDTTTAKTLTNEQLKPSETAARIAPKNQIVKVPSNPIKNKSVRQKSHSLTNIRQITDNKDALAVQKQSMPKLDISEEEDEDNSLRLADLFAEDEGS